ncbi:signal peptidase [Chryseobacterium sp. MMS23-Vi53]|uniref:signal peptidase n=1 Tax=Chryseobacterium sp. MMS23-Vi53 TaxID=3386644 RepID=UPI0039EA0437
MKTINKLVSALFLFAIAFVNAQPGGNPPGDGGGTVGPGAPPTSPIDMYVYALGIIAVMFIAFFTKKYSSKKA